MDYSSKKNDNTVSNKSQTQLLQTNKKTKSIGGLSDQILTNRSRGSNSGLQEDQDKLEGENKPLVKVENIELISGNEINNQIQNLKDFTDQKSDDEGKNGNQILGIDVEGDLYKKYEDINKYMQIINQKIQLSNVKVDSIAVLQQQKRIVMEQLRQYEKAYDVQKAAINEEKKNFSKFKSDNSNSYKYDTLLRYLSELIASKKETLKYIEDNEQLIRDCNWQSQVCQKMGKTLYTFHQTMYQELNILKYYNKTLPSKQETEYKEKMDNLLIQLNEEQDLRKKLEYELKNQVINFESLYCDAQEAKKIIKEQLLEIKDQKERLKTQTDELERKQKDFQKLSSSQISQHKDLHKDFDAESRRSDKISMTSHHHLQNIFRHKVNASKHQNIMNESQSSIDQKGDVRRKSKYEFNSSNQNKLYSEDDDDYENSYLETYGAHLNQKENEHKIEQYEFCINENSQQKNEQGKDEQLQIIKLQQNDSKIQKLTSPKLNNIIASPSPSCSPTNFNLSEQNQYSPNINRSNQKTVTKSALKKKLSDNINEDDLKNNSKLNIGLFDFNVVVESNNNNHNNKSLNSHNCLSSSGKKIFGQTTTQSFYNQTLASTNSGCSNSIYNQRELQHSNGNTLRNMMKQIQNSQNSLRKEILNYSITNNQLE